MTDVRRTLFEPDPTLEESIETVAVATPEPEPIVIEAVEPAPRRVNPWLVALWIFSAVLLIGSVAGYMSNYAIQFNGYSSTIVDGQLTVPFDILLSGVFMQFSPGAFAVGLASAVAAASIQAVQWMRRQSA
jgi:hypothetical protein